MLRRGTQFEQEAKDLTAHRRVEVGDRLVRDDHARLERERTRDHDALTLPARELVREPSEEPLREVGGPPWRGLGPRSPAPGPASLWILGPSATES